MATIKRSPWDIVPTRPAASPLLPQPTPPAPTPTPPTGFLPGEPDPNAPGPGVGRMPEAPPIDPNWNTNGYAAPGFYAERYGAAPAGWDATKWQDFSHQSPKYVVGRILSNYNLRDDAQLQRAVQDIQRAYQGTTWNGRDILDFSNVQGMNGIGQVDFLQDWDQARNPQWSDLNAERAQTAQGGAFAGAGAQGAGGTQSSAIQQMLSSLGRSPQGGMSPGSIPATFDDPETAELIRFINERRNQLMAPQANPSLDRYTQMAEQFAQQLSQPVVNPNAAEMDALLRKLLADVSGAPFSDQQSAALRAEAFENLEQDRAASLNRETRRMAMLGHGKSSGTIAEALGNVNKNFDQLRGQQGRNLTIAGIEQGNRNRDTAMGLANQIRQQGTIDQTMNETRQAQGLAALQAVTQALAAQRGENESRLDRALALTQIPVQLGDQRLQQAMQLLGMGGQSDPTSIFNSLMGLAGMTQNQNLAQQANNQNLWLGIGNMVAGLPWDQWFGGQR